MMQSHRTVPEPSCLRDWVFQFKLVHLLCLKPGVARQLVAYLLCCQQDVQSRVFFKGNSVGFQYITVVLHAAELLLIHRH
jgi:hypothetical protein